MVYPVAFKTNTMRVKLSTGGTMRASFGVVQYVSTGKQGLDGTTFYPEVTSEGEQCILSWSNDGEKPNPEPVNIRGKPGPPGQDGQNGSDATVVALSNLEIEKLLT